jgi:hypothetical protein
MIPSYIWSALEHLALHNPNQYIELRSLFDGYLMELIYFKAFEEN